jgi:hypothetical protein
MTRVDPVSCGAKTRAGTPCRLRAGHGTSHVGQGRCRRHGGASPNAEVAGAVELARRETALHAVPLDIEPHEAMLECVRIAAGWVRYSFERLNELDASDLTGPAITTRPRKLEKGAESKTERVREEHDARVHIWLRVHGEWSDRLVNYTRIALAAGIAERHVRIAEGQAELIAESLRKLAAALGFDPADPKVREAMRGSLTVIQGGRAA